MPPELTAQLILAACFLVIAAIIGMQVIRSEYGWQVWLLYVIERLHVGLMFRLRANRRCPFPAEGPALVIANHRSPVDPMLVWMNTHLTEGSTGQRQRIVSFLMAREYYEQPGVIGWISRCLRSIPVDRNGQDMSAVREALNRLRQGELIGIFPEGRLNEGEGLLPANPGIALLALRAKVPVYPMFLHHAPQSKRSMVAPFLIPSRVRVTYGDPIDLSPWYGRRKDRKTLSEVTNAMMRELARLGGTTYVPASAEDDSDNGQPETGRDSSDSRKAASPAAGETASAGSGGAAAAGKNGSLPPADTSASETTAETQSRTVL